MVPRVASKPADTLSTDRAAVCRNRADIIATTTTPWVMQVGLAAVAQVSIAVTKARSAPPDALAPDALDCLDVGPYYTLPAGIHPHRSTVSCDSSLVGRCGCIEGCVDRPRVLQRRRSVEVDISARVPPVHGREVHDRVVHDREVHGRGVHR